METLKVWNLYNFDLDNEWETHEGTFASMERARQEIRSRFDDADVDEVTWSGTDYWAKAVVIRNGRLFTEFIVRRTEVQA